jgi:hypothetical protein
MLPHRTVAVSVRRATSLMPVPFSIVSRLALASEQDQDARDESECSCYDDGDRH